MLYLSQEKGKEIKTMYEIVKNYTKVSHLIFDNLCEAIDFANGLVEDKLAAVVEVREATTKEYLYKVEA